MAGKESAMAKDGDPSNTVSGESLPSSQRSSSLSSGPPRLMPVTAIPVDDYNIDDDLDDDGDYRISKPQPSPTLNDVVEDSERRSIFNSVNFAGQVVEGSGEEMTTTEQQQQQPFDEGPQILPPARPDKKPLPPLPFASKLSIPPPSPANFRHRSTGQLSVNRPEAEKPLLDEIREVLAQSYLIFLLADLRLMSSTGRIGTKYETLAIDSDVCKRHTAAQISGMLEELEIGQCRGLSPAVIMAIVILEIRDTFVKTAEEKSTARIGKMGDAKILSTTVDIDTDERFVAYENDEAKKKMTEESMESLMRCYSRLVSEDLVTDIPNVKRRRETMFNNSFVSHQNPLGGPMARFSRRGFGSVATSVQDWQRRGFGSFATATGQDTTGEGTTEQDTTGDEILPKMPPPLSPIGRAISAPHSASTGSKMLGSVREETESEMGFEIRPIGSKESVASDDEKIVVPKSTGNLNVSFRDTQTNRSASSVTFADDTGTAQRRHSFFFSPARKRTSSLHGGDNAADGVPHQPHPSFREQVKLTKEKSRMLRERIITDYNDTIDNLLPTNHEANTRKEFQELTDVFFDQGQTNEEFKATLGVTYTRKEMVEVMRNAVATRNDAKLQFLSKFFKEGSLSNLMVQSHARVVWVNDWYPLKDLIYAISVDTLQRRVMVVFRGATTTEDWKSAFNFRFHKIRNPVQDEYDGRNEVLRVFSGLYKYLFRKRKDTGTTKYDEIANLVHKYGLERIGPDYKLFVTGHSLGGALTHFFSFFASTEQRFTKNGPVKAIAFASPYIGGHSWADAIRHQEQQKKLQLIQVRNNSDVIPRIPANFRIGKRGPLWRHVGICVTLPRLPRRLACGEKWKPLVHYWGKEKSCMHSTIHGFRRNIIFHFAYLRPWTLERSHTLFELQDRLMYGEQNSESGGDFELLRNTIDELYEKLYEHDFETFKKTKRWSRPTRN
jgi:hypothetical protein